MDTYYINKLIKGRNHPPYINSIGWLLYKEAIRILGTMSMYEKFVLLHKHGIWFKPTRGSKMIWLNTMASRILLGQVYQNWYLGKYEIICVKRVTNPVLITKPVYDIVIDDVIHSVNAKALVKENLK